MNKLSEILLSIVLCLPLISGSQSIAASNAPYPASKVITKLTWSPDIVKMEGCISGDNWPIAWVSDSLQITAFCDGRGFSRQAPDLSLGFAKIVGDPPGFSAENFESDADTPMGGGSSAIKASDMIAVDGILYMFVRNYKLAGSDNFTNSRLACSTADRSPDRCSASARMRTRAAGLILNPSA